MKRKLQPQLLPFVQEAGVYTVLMAGYLFLVVHFLAGWLQDLFRHQRPLYAGAALAAVVIQGFLLDWLTGFLLRGMTAKGARRP